MDQKRKKHNEVRVWLSEVSTLHRLQNQRVFRRLFPKLDVATVLPVAVFVYVDVPRQDRSGCSTGTAKKSSHPWHFRCWSPKRNELGSTNLVQCTEALHRFSSRDAIIVVSAGLEKHFDGDFSPENEKEITFKCWPPGVPKLKTLFGTQRVNVDCRW